MTIVGEREQYLGLLVEEYRLLGSAGIQAGQHTYTALQWGTAVVGILAGAAISQWGKHDAVVELVFLVGVPALVAVGMLYWVGELARISRLTDYLCAVEAKIELALRHPDQDSSGEWVASFTELWATARQDLLSAALVAMPNGPDGEVEVDGGPIAFERWLRRIRVGRASNNLVWVYLVRVLLFPSVMAASWATGLYYVLHSAGSGHGWENALAILVGLLLATMSTWFAAEIVSGLSHSLARPSPSLSWPRRRFRQLAARPLRITEWRG
jgi:hypothetical protein